MNFNPRPSTTTRRACLILLLAGLALRVLVFFFLAPQNTDNHFQIIQTIAGAHRVPHAGEFNQAYHPPLYHLLAAPLAAFGIKAVQGLSLLFSLLTLAVSHHFIRRLPWLDERLKPWCLALPALHPEFVLYTLLISNDTLSILLGALIFSAAARCLERPSLRAQILLALWLGLGLSTKYTFLAFVAPVALLIAFVNVRARLPRRTQALRLASLMLFSLTLGCYKYIDNALHYGAPFISNIDFGPAWVATQRPTWRGPATAFDINILKLIHQPVIAPATAHAWPLMLYGSFWYSYLPECGFRGNIVPPLNRAGSMIDLLALAPTLLMLAGAAAVLRTITIRSQRGTAIDQRLLLGFALGVVALNLAMIIAAGWQYDVCSIFQGRILFPSYLGFVLCFHEGLKLAARRRTLWLLARTMTLGLFLLFLLYYAIEIPLSIKYPVNPMRNVFARTQLDMNAR